MNTFGQKLKVRIFGTSHGPEVGVVVYGCPPGIELGEDAFTQDLDRRKPGAKGTTTRVETDEPVIRSGIIDGMTTGAPIEIAFLNKNVDPSSYEAIKNTPRPGHVDMVARQRYGDDHEHSGGGKFSGRLTVGLVAAGVIAKKLIPMKVEAKLTSVGGSKDIGSTVAKAVDEGDSIGGIVECTVTDVPVGLGEPFFGSTESLLSQMLFSIPGIKGVEFGAGFDAANMAGSQFNDAILDLDGTTATNNSGGINGGLTNGNPLVFRVAVRPTASISRSQQTVDLTTGEQVEIEVGGRHDACIALRMPVIIEAATAMVLADLLLQR